MNETKFTLLWCGVVKAPEMLLLALGHLWQVFYFPKNSNIMYQFNQSKCKPYACNVKEFQRKPYCPPPRPYSRQLTVSYLSNSNSLNVPFIRLCGKWLKDAGFSIDDKIKVTVKDNLLVLEPVK